MSWPFKKAIALDAVVKKYCLVKDLFNDNDCGQRTGLLMKTATARYRLIKKAGGAVKKRSVRTMLNEN